jgi:hypothetical protein
MPMHAEDALVVACGTCNQPAHALCKDALTGALIKRVHRTRLARAAAYWKDNPRPETPAMTTNYTTTRKTSHPDECPFCGERKKARGLAIHIGKKHPKQAEAWHKERNAAADREERERASQPVRLTGESMPLTDYLTLKQRADEDHGLDFEQWQAVRTPPHTHTMELVTVPILVCKCGSWRWAVKPTGAELA